ncbi:MAG: hypothetical protein JW822_09185 [Spirochaetales bacterium]|nr:hypothetical protein [Spirochaetales bacterium]
MRILYVSTFLTIIIDILVWLIIHLGISYLTYRIPVTLFKEKAWLYKERSWEKSGQIYKKIFKIKNWKGLLPDGAVFFKKGFHKSRMKNSSLSYLNTFVRETCRAELTHWLVFFVSPVFFLWNFIFVGIIMIVYALAVNVPCILTQRFNRIRLKRFINEKY